MNIDDAIKFFKLSKEGEPTHEQCRELIVKFYSDNLPAHYEYLEKGLYDDPGVGTYLTDFRAKMETIPEILNPQTKSI